MPDDLQAPPMREDGLQLSEDRILQRRLWRGERVAWCLFGLIIIAALLGLTGSGGYFSTQTIDFETGSVQFPRFARWQSSAAVSIEISGDKKQVAFGSAFSKNFTLETITPEPAKSVAADSLVMQFHDGSTGLGRIQIAIRPTNPGWFTFDVAVSGDREPVTIFVLP